MGCHFLLQCVKVKSENEVAQSCSTLGDPMDRSLPGSSAHGIFQARVLEWGAIAFSLGKNTGADCHALLQGIFPTQGSYPGLPHWRQILYRLSHQSFLKIQNVSPVPAQLLPSLQKESNKVEQSSKCLA